MYYCYGTVRVSVQRIVRSTIRATVRGTVRATVRDAVRATVRATIRMHLTHRKNLCFIPVLELILHRKLYYCQLSKCKVY